VRLWFHEQFRVFRDRLVNDTDRRWFTELCGQCVQPYLRGDQFDEGTVERVCVFVVVVVESADDFKRQQQQQQRCVAPRDCVRV
jgi:hypothetical protein